MNRIMLFFTAAWLLSASCNSKLSRAEIKDHLEKAMTREMQQRAEKNPLHPKFDVLDVNWFEERTYYACEFKVKMTLPDGKDTTGIMKQRVSKDFTNMNVPFNP